MKRLHNAHTNGVATPPEERPAACDSGEATPDRVATTRVASVCPEGSGTAFAWRTANPWGDQGRAAWFINREPLAPFRRAAPAW